MSGQGRNKPGITGMGMRGPGLRGPGRHMMMGSGEKARDFKGTMRQILVYLGSYIPAITLIIFIACASTVFTILGPKILGRATTKLFKGAMAQITGTGSIDFNFIGRIIIFVFGLYLLSTVLSYIQGWIMSGVSVKVTYRFRKDIAEKINRMPLKYFDGTSQGEVLSRITNDVDTVNRTLSQSLTQIVTSFVTVLGILVMMFSINWIMTLVALAVIPLSAIFVRLIVKKSQKYFKEQQEYIGHVNGHVEEMYGGHLVMKSFNGEERSIERFNTYNSTLYTVGWKSLFLSRMMMPLMTILGNVSYVAISILGGWLAVKKAITIGDIQAFIQYVRNFTRPMAQLANISNILQQTAAAAERVFEFLAEDEQSPEIDNSVNPADIHGGVVFRNIRFGYSPDKTVINNFSASVLPGQKIAIVGPTGAGKTTIVKLLMRYYDVTEGTILIDNLDSRDFTRKDLRSQFGMVLQDTWLFSGTIMENIRYGRLSATDDEVLNAARTANAHHFIQTLPGGYGMIINEEASNISHGQKQLLTIARAILADPGILILDEATSSVDTLTEIHIQQAMDNLMKGRTSFVIAHRLSTIRDADLILVMNEGDIVEQGTHRQLLMAGGFYEELYNSQFDSRAK
ncbi:MAG: ABC transporter ATP-binding protein [Spirochaetes bacterium]|nr:MAG: ABC transporter ATP-binding protein [Spirochaetota bacterium]RKX98029.1 MAG: ABC transporter ATP-binding protein [Spirochaetota bacterium]